MKRIYALSLGAALLIFGVLLLNAACNFDDIRVESPDARLASQVRAYIDSMPQRDLWRTMPFLLSKNLLAAIPDLQEVQLDRRLPNRLIIKAKPKRPLALWQDERGKVFLVSDLGEAYRPMLPGENLDLPVIRAERKRLKEASELIRLLHHLDSYWARSLSECLQGEGWELKFDQGRKWLLPFGERGITHMRRLVSGIQRHGWRDEPWRIDARDNKRWFMRQANIGGVI